MKRYSDKFIRDLAQLISHGPDPFDRLIDDLSDPSRRGILLEALSQLSQAALETTPASSKLLKPSKPFSYEDVEIPDVDGADPQAIDNLETIRLKLATSPNLKNRRVLSNLADELNIPLAKRDTMPRIVQKILTSLSARDSEDIAVALNRIRESDRDATESFMGLADFITRGSASN